MSHLQILLVLATLGPGPGSLSTSPAEPTCRAVLKGKAFTTSMELESGYRLEAVWTLAGFVRPEDSTDPGEIAAELLLETLSESDPLTGRSLTTSPLGQLRVQAVGRTHVAALQRASDSWCEAFVRATNEGVRLNGLAMLKPGRLT